MLDEYLPLCCIAFRFDLIQLMHNTVIHRYPPSSNPNSNQSTSLSSDGWLSSMRNAVRRLPNVLTEHQIRRLREHRYASEGTTLLDPYLQQYWRWLVELCPLWIAPNLLTLVGLAMNIITSVLLMIYTNGGTEPVRSALV
jgi:hypothetical protein